MPSARPPPTNIKQLSIAFSYHNHRICGCYRLHLQHSASHSWSCLVRWDPCKILPIRNLVSVYELWPSSNWFVVWILCLSLSSTNVIKLQPLQVTCNHSPRQHIPRYMMIDGYSSSKGSGLVCNFWERSFQQIGRPPIKSGSCLQTHIRACFKLRPALEHT